MHRIQRFVVLAAALAIAGPRALHAQDGKEDAAFFFVPGVVYQQAVFGDDDPLTDSGAGITVGMQFRAARSGSTAFAFEATFQPMAVHNPHYPEQFLPLYLQAGAQMGRGLYVRPSGGVAFQSGGFAPVIGVAVGRDLAFRDTFLAGAEFVLRASVSHGMAGWIGGMQIPLGARTETSAAATRRRGR
jgi:hypothetical protein